MIRSSLLNEWHAYPRLLSNISDDRRQLIEQAIINTGRTDLFCRDEAYALRDGLPQQPLPGYFGLHVKAMCDCSDFWAEVDRLAKTDYWRAWLALHETELPW